MQGVFNDQENIYLKEIRFLKYPATLSSYSSIKSEAIKMIQCGEILAPELSSINLLPSQIVKKLPRLPSNNIMMVILVLLQLSYQSNRSQELLNKIKRYAYDQSLQIIQLLEISERARCNQKIMRKLFVEFFHLTALSTEKNKVEKFMYQYPIIQCSFVLLFRKIMQIKGVADAGNLQLPVPTIWVIETLCKLFEINYRMISNGNFQIQGRKIIQDASYIYKVCEREIEPSRPLFSKEQEYIDRLLNDSDCQSELKLTSKTYNSLESRPDSSRPESSICKTFQYNTKEKGEPVALFPRKQVESYSNVKVINSNTPLSFAKGKPRSQTPTPTNSYIASKFNSSQSSHTVIPHPDDKLTKVAHQRSNSSSNLFNIQNNSSYYSSTPVLQRQKSYQFIPSVKVSSFSPQKRSKNFDYKIQQIPRTTTSPLIYFNQPLLSKNSNFLDRRWNVGKPENIESYRFDSKNYQFGY